jgi:hypothetical protein
MPTAGYKLQENMHKKTSGQQLGVTNTVQDIAFGSSEGNEETTQKGWRAIYYLKKYTTDLREEMLGDLKEDGQFSSGPQNISQLSMPLQQRRK